MEDIAKNIAPQELVPVLLGFSKKTYEAARRLFKKHGVVSHVFCPPVPFPFRFSLYIKFHFVGNTQDESLMACALTDFAKQIGNKDVILYLIPCAKGYTAMIKRERAQLEHYYVFANKAELSWLFYNRMLIKEEKEHGS